MIDPTQVIEVFKTATSHLIVPTPTTSTPDVGPLPSVVPVQPIYEKVHDAGIKTLWVVFVVFFISTLVFAYLAWRTPVQKRLFHVLTTFIAAFATLSYFALATGSGNSLAETLIKESHKHVPPTVKEHIFRQVFWGRYIEWALTTPLILLNLAFLAGLSGANILVVILTDLILVFTGLFAAYGVSNAQKWAWFAMAIVAYLVLLYIFVVPGRRAASAKDNKTSKLYIVIGSYVLIVWLLYPIVWAISGAHKWSVDAEVIAYAVLDILAKPVFGFWLLFAHGNAILPVEGFWSHGLAHEGGVRLVDDDEA